MKTHWLTDGEMHKLGRSQHTPRCMGDPIAQYDDLWYFWDEVWSQCFGPFKNRDEADISLKEYCVANKLGVKMLNTFYNTDISFSLSAINLMNIEVCIYITQAVFITFITIAIVRRLKKLHRR